jgi:hypothetical protein
MSSPLEQAGAVREPSQYAALSMDRGITGLWTQRSPLRDADVPYLYGKFYSASRFDSLLDGLNREISARLTYRRRPGSSIFNSNNFPAINSFYSWKRIVNGVEVLRVLADGADGTIYDATPPGKTAVFTKASGAGKARFQGVNTSLFFADGVENMKWLQPGPWTAQTSQLATQYAVGTYILDNESTPKLQYLQSVQVGTVTNVEVIDKSVSLTFSATNFNLQAGMTFRLALGTATFLNGKLLIATSVSGTAVTAFFDHVNYASASDTGTATTMDAGTLATTGATQPTWGTGLGNLTIDGLSTWLNCGNPLFNWTPAAPVLAPGIVPVAGASETFWKPLATYVEGNVLLDENGFIQAYLGGTTGGVLPEFQSPYVTPSLIQIGGNATSGIPPGNVESSLQNVGITQDGGAKWAGSFWFGSFVSITAYTSPFTYTTTNIVVLNGPQPWQPGINVANVGQSFSGGAVLGDVCVDSNGNLQMVVGGSGISGTTAPTWNTTYGGTTTESTGGGLVWKNLGPYLAIAFEGREYAYAYHGVDGSWSSLSPLSPSTYGLLGGVTVSGVYSTDLQVDSVGIFHTADGQSTPLLLATIPNNTAGGSWTFNDEWDDSALDAEIPGPQNEINNPPPVGMTAPLYHLGRVWGIYENGVIHSGGPDTITGNGNTAFAPAAFYPMVEQPIRLASAMTSAGPALLIWSRSNLYVILGSGTATSPFQQVALYMQDCGILNYDAICQVGSTFHGFGNTALIGGNVVGKAFSLDPGSGYVEFGFPIGDQFQNVTTGAGGATPSNAPLGYLYNPANAFVTWAELGSGDTALYVADGSVGWFRYSPVASPETGFLWSPRAVILGGTSAVQALQTQPGVNQLLIGPSGLIQGQGSVANNSLQWTSGPQFDSGMVGETVTLTTSTGSSAVAITGFTSATQLQLGVSFPPSPTAVSWSIAQEGPILFRDSTVNADWIDGSYEAYPSYDVKGCIQLCLTGELAEIAHIHLVSTAVGARPLVGILPNEILPTSAAPFAWLSSTSPEPPDLKSLQSQTLYSDRYQVMQSGTTGKCLFFQLGMDYGAQNYPDETLLFSIYGAKYAERRQQ